MAPLPSGKYLIRSYDQNNPGNKLYLTHYGPQGQLRVTDSDRQVWDVTLLDPERGGHNICATDVGGPENYVRDEMNGTVILGRETRLGVGVDNEQKDSLDGSDLYSIFGPWQQGVYGADVWIGPKNNEVVRRVSRNRPGPELMDSYLWAFERVDQD